MARVVSAKEGVARCLEPLREAMQLIEQRLARKGQIKHVFCLRSGQIKHAARMRDFGRS